MAKKDAAAPARQAMRDVRLIVRMPGAHEVVVTGDFTEWSKQGVPMTQRSDDEWQVSLQLKPGRYQYRLIVDGEWRDDPGAEQRVPNPFGTENCLFTVR
jgi:1,4-alpha-glucan branching enzyme